MGEAGTRFLEEVLSPDLAKKVTEARPENVAARQEAERPTDLSGRPIAHPGPTVSGEEQGTLAVDLPFERTEDEAEVDPDYPDEPPAMPWPKVLLEAGDTIWYWDSAGPGTIDVAASSVSFDLPMVSAVSTIRATGTITRA